MKPRHGHPLISKPDRATETYSIYEALHSDCSVSFLTYVRKGSWYSNSLAENGFVDPLTSFEHVLDIVALIGWCALLVHNNLVCPLNNFLLQILFRGFFVRVLGLCMYSAGWSRLSSCADLLEAFKVMSDQNTCMYCDHNTCMHYDHSICMYYDCTTSMYYHNNTCMCYDMLYACRKT